VSYPISIQNRKKRKVKISYRTVAFSNLPVTALMKSAVSLLYKSLNRREIE